MFVIRELNSDKNVTCGSDLDSMNSLAESYCASTGKAYQVYELVLRSTVTSTVVVKENSNG